MLETRRAWSGEEQRKNSVGLGTFKFLLFFVYLCVVLGWGSVGGDVHLEQAVSRLWLFTWIYRFYLVPLYQLQCEKEFLIHAKLKEHRTVESSWFGGLYEETGPCGP